MSIRWKVSTTELDPAFVADVSQVLAEDPAQWVVTYGFRTSTEQAVLYEKYLAGGPLAAPPGKSAHERGRAVDITLVRGSEDVWDYQDPDWRRLVEKIHAHPRLHSLDDIGDTDHIEQLGWQRLGPYLPAARVDA